MVLSYCQLANKVLRVELETIREYFGINLKFWLILLAGREVDLVCYEIIIIFYSWTYIVLESGTSLNINLC